MHCGLVKNVLTISPPSVVRKVWLKEVKKVAQFFPDLDGKLAIVEYSSDFSREERDRALRETKSKGMWLLTIASNCLIHDNNNGLFSSAGKCQSWWSMIVVDEVWYLLLRAHRKHRKKFATLTETEPICRPTRQKIPVPTFGKHCSPLV